MIVAFHSRLKKRDNKEDSGNTGDDFKTLLISNGLSMEKFPRSFRQDLFHLLGILKN